MTSRGARPAIVHIEAVDDTGRRFGPTAVPLEAGHTLELTSSDLEGGNPIKGLARGLGTGQGDWRVVLKSDAELDALAYAENAEGLRTPLRNIAPSPDQLRHIPLFPVANGLLRLSNPGAEAVEARIRARDDARLMSEVRVALPPGTSRWLAASALESGQGISGALGDGTGDWRLAIQAPARIQALAFSSSAGELANLHATRWQSSPSEGRHSAFLGADRRLLRQCAAGAPNGAQGKAECLPSEAHAAWLPATMSGGEGLLRIANRSARSGTATLHREGHGPQEPVTLRLDANAAATLTASDLEFGNPAKGQPRGFGAPSGDLRMTVRSQLDLDVLSYARGPNGTVSAMHDAAPRSAPNRHVVPMFPSGGSDAEGRLLLTSRSDSPTRIRVAGVDDEGRASQTATLTLPAKATQTLTSAQLAWGAPSLDGWLGAANGHWRLAVWSDGPIEATALLASPSGGIANISASSSSLSSSGNAPQPIGDLNGDGKDDILLRHADGRWMYYPMNGRRPIESQRGTVPLERSAHWQLAGTADMDADGKDDILLRHTDGRWKGYLMDGRTVRDSGSIAGLPTSTEWKVAGLGDLGGRNKAEVVLRAPDGRWNILPLDGLTVAPHAAVEPNLTKSLKWSVAGIADLNGDGRDDILLRHDDGRWHYYPMNGGLAGAGSGSVTGVTRSLDWQLAGLGDLDGNGNDDILLRHVEGRWTYYPMNGRNVADGRGGVSITPNTAWQLAGLGDLNGDSKDDVLLRHTDGRWTYYPLDGRTILAGRGTASITRNLDWSTKGPEPDPGDPDGGAADETAEAVFHASISAIVQSQCATCHREGGVSGNTRLVFEAGANQQTANQAVFENFLAEVEDGATLILNKVQGVSHGGGIQLVAGAAGFKSLERFLGLLEGGPDGGPSVAPAALFAGVKMEPARSTLRRAAIVFAGRVPTDAEYESVETGDNASLRKAIRGLMAGPGFHEFLIRAANDRLLTDRENGTIDPIFGYFVAFNNINHRKAVAALEQYARVWDDPNYSRWRREVGHGIDRASLELIAHVVKNDLPYTEVLTADYIMANPFAAEAYGDTAAFLDPADAHEFNPSRIASYYRKCDGHQMEYHITTGARVIDPGPCATDYPHAGLLNATVFLLRYPTTATNRNRARSRWTYYHFLGLDVEKSASRTTDPVALADTNNPTLNNPACTVCHSVLDPVAGAFQNYDEIGYFRTAWGGLDSLDNDYRRGALAQLLVAADSYDTRETFSVAADLDKDSLLVIRHHQNNGCGRGTCGRDLRIDRLAVRDRQGVLVDVVEWSELDKNCDHDGRYNEGTGDDDHYQWWGWGCATIPIDILSPGRYVIEVVVWADQAGEEVTWFELGARLYRDGDTWYRDMRSPGFDGRPVPDADQSLQWLATRIVADPRFAEATVKFWWPAIMGADVAQPPAEGAPDFAGRLLASNAQSAEVKRLARDFRRGFDGGKPHNLKDLLTEIVLSDWFRADSVAGDDPIRAVALANAGAKRLLTPEELARKTLALTGFDWQRSKPRTWHHPGDPQNWINTERGFGLLYGGIDSDGITKRGRDFTSVMSGVAQRLASATACPVAMKDFYLVPAGERRLFAGIDVAVSPGQSGRLTITAERGIRNKLVELHARLLGVDLAPSSPEIDAALALFVETWQRHESDGNQFPGARCDTWRDQHYFDGIADDIWQEELDENGNPKGWDWDRMREFIWEETDRSDPHGLARTWTVILAYLMTDPRYLHL